MTADIQTLSFITHQLEKLPLKDSGFANEKLSSLFYCRSYGDEKFLHRKRTRANRVSQNPEPTTETFLSASVPFAIDANKESTSNPNSKGKQVTEQGSQLVVQTILENSGNKYSAKSFTSPNKRKRPTESVGFECSPITKFCDEEVKTLCRGHENNNARENHGGIDSKRVVFMNDEVRTAWTASNSYSNKIVKPELRKWRGRPSINVEQMQRSGFWFPFKSKGNERKVKIIKVTPCDPDKSRLGLETYIPELKENCLFRPIAREDGDSK